MEKAPNLLKRLLEAGVHFGHQTRRWNPRMRQFIFGERNGIHIIDLEKTQACLNDACNFVRTVAEGKGSILFVGTKRQAKDIIAEQASRCGMFYVNARWLGGTLTNFQTVRKSVDRYRDIKLMFEDGTMEMITKKEKIRLGKEYAKLDRNLCGIADMDRLPQALFIIDSQREDIAVREATRLGIPIIALVDTNANPREVAFPIPANDDAIRSIKLMTTMMATSILKGREAAGLLNPEEGQPAVTTVAPVESAPVAPSEDQPAATPVAPVEPAPVAPSEDQPAATPVAPEPAPVAPSEDQPAATPVTPEPAPVAPSEDQPAAIDAVEKDTDKKE